LEIVSSGVQKRPRPDEDAEMTSEEPTKHRSATTSQSCAQQSNCAGEAFQSGSSCARPNNRAGAGSQSGFTADEFGLNFPLPWEEKRGQGSSVACIVKLYDADVEALHLCESVEIVGVLCVNPEIASFDTTPLSDADICRDARNPSTALVPRIHAILVRRLPFHHPLFPFSPLFLSEARLLAAFQQGFAEAGAIAVARRAAVEQLGRYLGGDMLAAEYMLLLLVSRAFSKLGDKSLGCWSLNLMNWPSGVQVGDFCGAAAELVPLSVHLEVNCETLGSRRWRPCKDFVANRLLASQLQLAPGTLLVLDET